MCGGKVTSVEKEKPKRAKPVALKARYKRWEKIKKKSKNAEDNFDEQLRSDAFDTLKQASVASIFIVDILTFGLRSAFWMSGRIKPLENMARNGESAGKSALYAWFMGHAAAFVLTFATARELFLSGWDLSIIAQSAFPRAAAAVCSFVVSFVAAKHLQFWTREVIRDAIEHEKPDTLRTKAGEFATSPFMIWFFGIPYLQFHLNEIVRARNLAYFKYSKKAPPRLE
jgi:hypothetical protein